MPLAINVKAGIWAISSLNTRLLPSISWSFLRVLLRNQSGDYGNRNAFDMADSRTIAGALNQLQADPIHDLLHSRDCDFFAEICDALLW